MSGQSIQNFYSKKTADEKIWEMLRHADNVRSITDFDPADPTLVLTRIMDTPEHKSAICTTDKLAVYIGVTEDPAHLTRVTNPDPDLPVYHILVKFGPPVLIEDLETWHEWESLVLFSQKYEDAHPDFVHIRLAHNLFIQKQLIT